MVNALSEEDGHELEVGDIVRERNVDEHRQQIIWVRVDRIDAAEGNTGWVAAAGRRDHDGADLGQRTGIVLVGPLEALRDLEQGGVAVDRAADPDLVGRGQADPDHQARVAEERTVAVAPSARSTRPTRPAPVTTAMPGWIPALAPLSIVITSESKLPTAPRMTVAVAVRGHRCSRCWLRKQRPERLSFGFDFHGVAAQLVKFELERISLGFEVVVVEDRVPGVGERGRDRTRNVGHGVEDITHESLCCAQRAEAAEI